ncbi:procathepsin L-like [Mya arenaria]|uniref:procathepsin L-like n=1 Tax=Mya arenaria TaxID=6604 RepID=UPI0022E88599|nr:procathepsin L-like [Mya arenaria]
MKCVATFAALLCVFHLGAALNSWQLPDDANLWSAINADLDMDWVAFKKSYNRTYSSNREEMERRIYWEDAIKFIQEHNLRFDRGEETYSVGENDFADMAEDEFQRIYLSGLVIPPEVEQELEEEVVDYEDDMDDDLPLEVDWRSKGAVTSVKNQGSCGSCWAFSALGSLESAVKIKTGKTVDLSEQELVDCAYRSYGNYGCRGGWMNNGFKYIEKRGGVDSESCYRYTGRRSYRCQHKSSCVGARMAGHRNTRRGSESDLARTLSQRGPVAIAADVSSRGFMHYRRGVYYNPRCNKRRVNHAMVNVGFGASSRGKYWIIKNSWGQRWGDQGYIFMAKDRGDTCGLSNYASYPVL